MREETGEQRHNPGVRLKHAMVVEVGGETDDQYAKEYSVGVFLCGHKTRML